MASEPLMIELLASLAVIAGTVAVVGYGLFWTYKNSKKEEE